MYIFLLLLSNEGTPGREETFAERVTAFNAHANKMSATAADLARSGGVMDKQVADDLISTAGKVSYVTGHRTLFRSRDCTEFLGVASELYR